MSPKGRSRTTVILLDIPGMGRCTLALLCLSLVLSLGFRYSGAELVQGWSLAAWLATQESSSISDRPSHPSRGT